jgi:hypothetical protein
VSELRDHLKAMVNMRRAIDQRSTVLSAYFGAEDLVLRHGSVWIGAERPGDVRQQEIKQCYANAFWLANESDGKLCYVEGFSFSIIPAMHAWCVDRSGRVVDPTWRNDPDREYIGLPLEAEWHLEYVLKYRMIGILDDWQNQWPALSGKTEPRYNDEFRS